MVMTSRHLGTRLYVIEKELTKNISYARQSAMKRITRSHVTACRESLLKDGKKTGFYQSQSGFSSQRSSLLSQSAYDTSTSVVYGFVGAPLSSLFRRDKFFQIHSWPIAVQRCGYASRPAKASDESLETDLQNPTFASFVQQLVEEKRLRPPVHAALVAKINDYDLSLADFRDLIRVVEDDDVDDDDEFKKLAAVEAEQSRMALRRIGDDVVDIVSAGVAEVDAAIAVMDLDRRNVTLEFEEGTGGVEAKIFNGEIFEMYRKYADYKGWSFRVTEIKYEPGPSGTQILVRATAQVSGADAYECLKFEAGVHRVQRVPTTEKRGRLQTSTCVVVVTPTVQDPQIEIRPADVKWDFFKSSGPGGQAVNTASSAVRLTHHSSGMVVECQEERSQSLNKDQAMEKLKAKLVAVERDRVLSSQQRERRLQIGTRDRCEKIRTYNFPAGRVTDHRLGGANLGTPQAFLGGGQVLDDLVDALNVAHRKEILLEWLRKFATEA